MTLGRDKEIKECKVWSTILFNEKGRTGRQTEHLAPTYLPTNKEDEQKSDHVRMYYYIQGPDKLAPV